MGERADCSDVATQLEATTMKGQRVHTLDLPKPSAVSHTANGAVNEVAGWLDNLEVGWFHKLHLARMVFGFTTLASIQEVRSLTRAASPAYASSHPSALTLHPISSACT